MPLGLEEAQELGAEVEVHLRGWGGGGDQDGVMVENSILQGFSWLLMTVV